MLAAMPGSSASFLAFIVFWRFGALCFAALEMFSCTVACVRRVRGARVVWTPAWRPLLGGPSLHRFALRDDRLRDAALDALDPLRVDRELLRERPRPPELRQRDALLLEHGGDRVEGGELLFWGSGSSESRQGVAPRAHGGADEMRDPRHARDDVQL